jgi:X-X-X-Leu-X-X-Gly heptad repeat protein
MKKVLSLIIAVTLVFSTAISATAADISIPKEEVVYGILNLDGSVNNLYVVNIFPGGVITDYGNYSDVRNMTTSEKINQSGDQITVQTSADKLYYQGTLATKELPWDIAISYFLDGEDISETELAGKSGKVKITISVKQNMEINSNFYDNYALQISLSLDNKLCSNIIADNATVAEAGSNKQLAYTVLPGNGIDITVTADVRDFEMDAITINGIRLSLGIDVDTTEFTDQITQLADAIKGLDDGAAEILEGMNQLSNGMQEYMDGMKAFSDGLGELSIGADKLSTGATELKNGMSELAKQNDSLINGAVAIQQATFDTVNAQLGGMGMGLPVLTPENYSEVLSPIPNLSEVKLQLDGVVQFTQGLKGYMYGVDQLSKGASDLSMGTAEFAASSSVIAASANQLYSAGVEINEGIKKLRDGLAAYKDGTKELKDGTSDMGSKINDQVDEMLGSISGHGEEVISFVSDKNTNISAVQFVLKTDSIKIPEIPIVDTPQPVKLNFWQKLLKLFGLYK